MKTMSYRIACAFGACLATLCLAVASSAPVITTTHLFAGVAA